MKLIVLTHVHFDHAENAAALSKRYNITVTESLRSNKTMTHKEVQQIAKDTIEALRQNIHAGMTLDDVRAFCENKMLELGADYFWYWDVGDVEFFTFEPHISRPASVFGYKKENIYYFDNGALTEL